MTRIGVYVRISQDPDGTETATARQLFDCAKFAELRGWEVADTFRDADLSAYKPGVTRPEFERMLVGVREKRIDGVLAWKIDRLSRRLRDFAALDEACEAAGGFIATMQGVDTREEHGRFLATILVGQARMESANASSRLAREAKESADQGRPSVGGTRAFGYTRDRSALVETEAALIREAVARLIAGEGVRGIARDWGRRGVVTPTGKAWRRGSLTRMLRGAAISGQREHQGVLKAGTWPPIISPDDLRRLRLVLDDAGRRTNVVARRYLLAGLVYCGRCGERMTSRPTALGTRRYICTKDQGGCGRMARVAEPVEELVKEAVCIALDGVDLRAYVRQPADRSAELLAAIRDDEAGLEQLSKDHYVDRLIGRSEFLAARDALNARLEENRRRVARTNGRGALAGLVGAGEQVRGEWESRDLDWRRAVIGALVDRVEISAGARGGKAFHPELVRIVWKF